MIQFNRKYFLLTVLLFGIEVLIALFAHDRIIRPYVGDYLVVILIYCFVKSLLNLPVMATAVGVLLFSFTIEMLQYLNFIAFIGLENNHLANVVIGNSYQWIDLVAYVLGIITVIIIERLCLLLSKND